MARSPALRFRCPRFRGRESDVHDARDLDTVGDPPAPTTINPKADVQ